MTIAVNPEILVWAREAAGFSLDEAAAKLTLSSSAKSTAADKLAALESGEKAPTRNQLNDMANVYRRPLLTFYMAGPPRKAGRGHDFRQSPDARTRRENAMLDTLLRDVLVRQQMVRELLEDEEEAMPLPFVGSIAMRQGVAHAVDALSTLLGFNTLAPRKGSPEALFKRLREAAEGVGIFVLVLGDLGSYHHTIPASVFRGFAIADPVAPFVVINSKDARAARVFTLVHELVHILLGQTGVSGTVSTATPTTEDARIERFCNDVAGEFLLPQNAYRHDVAAFGVNDLEAARLAVEQIATRWSVSEPMVAYRLNREGDLSAGVYEALRAEFYTRWLATLKRERDRSSSGPHPRVVKQFSLGDALVSLVHRTLRGNTLSHTKAASLLGAQPNAVEPMLRHFESNRGTFVSGAN
ncbi:ImmA/IrrE family metallo-endopeptidase [Paracoccus salsus]|uniref:ImmA/IrrE family metallo-endopeptidase n=1 Tax=Paracoccus salsus TaxID=2911061 RepID=UPI001F3380B2|nr:ImmA/IrrE family metallo-endopeptidase [Paracoccus salsus]MCF3973926.1 ImmA/IrrE family metallo-endopeptidase [Paracoccus salsus]